MSCRIRPTSSCTASILLVRVVWHKATADYHDAIAAMTSGIPAEEEAGISDASVWDAMLAVATWA